MKKDLLHELLMPGEENVSQLAEKILNESLLQFRIKKLREEIDLALQERNQEKFMELTNQLKELLP